MFERYTELARNVVVDAGDRALANNNEQVTSLHLLRALADSRGSLAYDVLKELGLDQPPSVDFPEEAIRPADAGYVLNGLPISAPLYQIFKLALREALSLGHKQIGTEHLLLALVRGPLGQGLSHIFNHASAEEVRTEVIRQLNSKVDTSHKDQSLLDRVRRDKHEAIEATEFEYAMILRDFERRLVQQKRESDEQRQRDARTMLELLEASHDGVTFGLSGSTAIIKIDLDEVGDFPEAVTQLHTALPPIKECLTD